MFFLLFYIFVKINILPFRKLYLSTTKINYTVYYSIAICIESQYGIKIAGRNTNNFVRPKIRAFVPRRKNRATQ